MKNANTAQARFFLIVHEIEKNRSRQLNLLLGLFFFSEICCPHLRNEYKLVFIRKFQDCYRMQCFCKFLHLWYYAALQTSS